MLKLKPTKLLMLACLLLAGYACTTKNEVPQPVVDTARVDALRTQLIALQQQVLGEQQTASNDSLTLTQLQTEIAQLKAYLQKTVSYTVTVSSFLFKPLAGATVKLSQGGKIVSGTTTSNGSTTFSGLYAGIITATVDLSGFARLVFRADIRNSFDGAAVYSTTSRVLMIPLFGTGQPGGTTQADSCMTTQYWKLYANYSMVDDTLGGPVVQSQVGPTAFNPTPASKPLLALPAGPDPNKPNVSYNAVTGQTITAYLNQFSFLNGYGTNYQSLAVPQGFTGWDVYLNNTGQTGNGQVLSVSYENAKWTATADVNGIYTIKLPASDISNVSGYVNTANSFGFVLDFGEFTQNFTQYTSTSTPYIINKSFPALPTYTSTYIYRMDDPGSYNSNDPTNFQWTSIQATSLTSAWPFFYTGSLK